MHHYPWHPGDYLKRTAHWSEDRTTVEVEAGLLRDLAYRRLLDEYYGEEAPIPSKTRLVAIRIRMLKHEDIVSSVLKEKFTLVDGFWRQDRVDTTLESYRKKVDIARENGKKGGRPKSLEPTNNQVGCKLLTTNNQEPRTNPPLPPGGDEGFCEFWSGYPNKAGKPQAMKAWATAVYGSGKRKPRATMQEIAAGVALHRTCSQWVKDRGAFIPHAASWLNGDMWNVMPLQPDVIGGGEPWWETRTGTVQKGLELCLPPPPEFKEEGYDPNWFAWMASVWVAAGHEGPWWDKRSEAYVIAMALKGGL